MNRQSEQECRAMDTERLTLRPWREDDAEALFRYASDPDIGSAAGWPPHTSLEMSRMVIREVFSFPETYAIVLKSTGEPVGCCGLVPEGARPNDRIGDDAAEIGYWIGKPYWGKGFVPEALKALIDRAFTVLGKKTLWIGFYPDNLKSRRVAEKCGFHFSHIRNIDSATEEFFLLNHTPEMKIVESTSEINRLMPLLLIGDESQEMIARYIGHAKVFEGIVNERSAAVCAAVDNCDGTVEIKNLAVHPGFRHCGIGRLMLEHVESLYPGHTIMLGTGETPSTLRFYQSCGYRYSHRVAGFFADHYPAPIVEEGVQLNDMIYLVKHI